MGTGPKSIVAAAVAFVAISSFAALPLHGGPILLGTVGRGGALSTLVQIDPATGNLIRTIGDVGFAVNGLTYDTSTGTLYGSTSLNDPNYTGLIEIDMITGAGTAIGVHGFGLPSGTIAGLASSAAGDLYGWWEPMEDDLVSIDRTTGAATRVGEAAIGTGTSGLAFDTGGTLFFFNGDGHVHSIDTVTGDSTWLYYLGVIAHHGDFDPVTNRYFGLSTPGVSQRSIVVVDSVAGTVLSTVPTVDNLHTLTFADAASIPEASTLGLLGVGLLALGLLRRRRQ